MGLVFALQPDLRRSTPESLALRSAKRRFSLGGTFIFVGAFLGTMYLAAAPLFKVFWSEGNLYDRAFASFFYSLIFLYPIAAILCWFYEECVDIRRRADGHYEVTRFHKVLGFAWGHQTLKGIAWEELHIENWKGARNVASLKSEERKSASLAGQNPLPTVPSPDRYATRGHWILRVRHGRQILDLERRAKRDEIELLKAQAAAFFSRPA